MYNTGTRNQSLRPSKTFKFSYCRPWSCQRSTLCFFGIKLSPRQILFRWALHQGGHEKMREKNLPLSNSKHFNVHLGTINKIFYT
jgi:hypothetical protein